jgi:hypothetical protein
MAQSSFLKVCSSCGEDFAKAAPECPHCGKKVQSAKFLMLIIGIGCLALAATFAIPVGNDQSDDMEKIASAAVDPVNIAELAGVFKGKNSQSNSRAQDKAKEITGKIIQWDVEVFVCTQSGGYYQMVTKSTAGAPGTLLKIYPRDSQQKTYLDNIKPGNRIKVKGKISGMQQGRLKIDPAIVM